MADSKGHSGPTPPRYRVDGQLTGQKPPKSDRRPIEAFERPPEGGRPVLVFGAAQDRPAFPSRPLDPKCVKAAQLTAEDREEAVRLVRLVLTDFDPENDPRGWDSVAEIVRGSGRPPDEVRQMDYRELGAFFRVNHEAQKIRLGGAIETNTPSIVSAEIPPPPPPADGRRIVLGRADLTRRLQDDWATPGGKRFLLGSTVRDIAKHYGLEAHSSLYSNDFWKTVIKPARKMTGFRAKAIDWVDSLSRDRR